MKVLTCTSPGSFQYSDQAVPVLSKGNAIIRIKRIGICGTDLHAFEGTQPYFNYPRVLGHELSGELVDADEVDGFKKGETVTIIPYFSCGTCIACRSGKTNCCASLKVFGVHLDGGMKEYISVPSSSLVHGDGLSEDALALIEPLSVGAHSIRRADVKPGEFVLVVGAGPIGLGVMKFAQMAGGKVIALDINARRLTFCDTPYTIDGSKEDVTRKLTEITSGDMPAIVIDATGSLNAINNSFRYIAHGGRYILVGLQKGDVNFSHPEFHKREATLMSSRNATREDFNQVIAAMKLGRIEASNYITHRVSFGRVKDEFPGWLDVNSGVIKAVVEIRE